MRSQSIDVQGFGRFWFDHVLHLLYFGDPAVEQFASQVLGPDMKPCPPVAWVQTPTATCRYPLQLNLSPFPPQTIAKCIADLAKAQHGPPPISAPNLHEALLRTFGVGLCDLFLHPYNRKVWGRPLETLAPKIGWTTTRPDLESVVQGALSVSSNLPYNHNGWYPRPPASADLRGMGVLSASIASRVPELMLEHRVVAVDLETKAVGVETPDGFKTIVYENLVSTIPLPALARATSDLPAHLVRATKELKHNRVWSVGICISGSRPDQGLWRYYSDESICFTRLVFMHEFDDLSAPPGCWGLLAEVTQPAEEPLPDINVLIRRVLADAKRSGGIGANCEVVGVQAWSCDPAYVVDTPATEQTVTELTRFFNVHGVHLLGRYGRWDYLSMAQVMGEALALATALDPARPAKGAR
ncbi:MAG: protoporphyrinogen/coproporphyrinogen oxidase [Sphingomonadaceae bacterium]